MNYKKFTEEEIQQLRGNKYVHSVGERHVFFTEEFKRLYWELYTGENLIPCEAMRRLGMDYHLLGRSRVRGFTYGLKQRHERAGGNHGAEKCKQSVKQTPQEELEKLRAENKYLKQELEFVKKIVAAGGKVKR